MAFVDLNDAVISQVRDAADIVDFVQQVTPLKPAGAAKYKGLCPFHREKTPSFNVDRSKGLFYCFGCGTGGDIFKFLTLTERFTFPEAVEHVAARVGIELPRKRKTQRDSDKDDLFEVIDDASEAFHQALAWTPNAADDYLKQRNVAKEIVTRYGFGFAPDSWDYILRRLGQKHGEKRLELAGLITPRKEKTGYYDRFRNRLMIPIHSDTGAIVGFGGRSLDGSEPKYLNSPESELFNKSRLLYNLHRSKAQIRRDQRAILVEGYFDAIALDFAGVPGVVASMGTSFAASQCAHLRRFSKKVVIAYDSDAAGRAAALRAAAPLLASDMDVFVIDLLGQKDPDSFIQNLGYDQFMEQLAKATDVFRFTLEPLEYQGSKLPAHEKSAIVEQFLPVLSATVNQVARNDGAQRIADALGLEFAVVWDRVRGKAKGTYERERSAPIPNGEKFVLTAALQGRLTADQMGRLREEYFEDPACKTVFSIIKTDLASGQPIDFANVSTHLRGEAELTLLSELSLSEDLDDRSLERIDENLRPMERGYLSRRMEQIQREIRETPDDAERVAELYQEKIQLSRMLHSLK